MIISHYRCDGCGEECDPESMTTFWVGSDHDMDMCEHCCVVDPIIRNESNRDRDLCEHCYNQEVLEKWEDLGRFIRNGIPVEFSKDSERRAIEAHLVTVRNLIREITDRQEYARMHEPIYTGGSE